MTKKSIILSSSGLKNIILQDQEDNFTLKFGKREIKMHKIFAEFLSPKISHLHQCDPTIDSIIFDDNIITKSKIFNTKAEDFLNDEIFYQLQQISSGNPIEVDSKSAPQLRYLCFLLCNNELLSKIDSLFPLNFSQMNMSELIQELKYIESVPTSEYQNYYSELIDYISKNFSTFSKEQLKELPKSILYSIILNDNFKHDDEDSLIDLIEEIFVNCEDFDIIQFYEIVDISKLSMNKFKELFSHINYDKMTRTLWDKLNDFIQNHLSTETLNDLKKENKNIIKIEFKDESNKLHGIIQHLTDECGGNVCDKGIINVTASSIGNNKPKRVVDINSNTYFQTNWDTFNQWIKYDFKEKRVRPTYYVIRTMSGFCPGGNPQNWSFEGSNTDNEQDWTILDTRQDEMSTKNAGCTGVFNITTKLKKNESFRYLRLRQTGNSSNNYKSLILSALEIFGELIQ